MAQGGDTTAGDRSLKHLQKFEYEIDDHLKCQSENVIYEITCNHKCTDKCKQKTNNYEECSCPDPCDFVYIGKTTNSSSKRFDEHLIKAFKDKDEKKVEEC